MPVDPVPRTLFYIAWLLAFCLAATFPWWAAANAARTEFRSLTSAFAFTMRLYFYSICLLVILVCWKSLGFALPDPLLARLHLGGTALLSGPCAWRAFRQKGPRLLLAVALGWILTAALGLLLWRIDPLPFETFPRYLVRPR